MFSPRGLLVLLFLAGCARVTRPPVPLAPPDIPQLEAALRRDTSDTGAQLRLAVAYREAGRLAEARGLLEPLVSAKPADAPAILQLGLTYEGLGEWRAAHDAYARYVEVRGSGEFTDRIRSRLAFVHRKELEAEVRATVAREAGTGRLEPNAVAVFPFVFQGSDTTLRPLGRALAEMLVTDLSQTDRLRVLERLHVQLLLDELRLGQTSWVDSATAARGGRMLRAGRVVQGSIRGSPQSLQLGAVLVGVEDTRVRLTPVTERAALTRLFEMEKRLALALFQSLGVQLTAAERERVLQWPTANLQALLAFGRGLEAEDRGDYALAATHYARAIALDPGFRTAETRGRIVTSISQSETVTIQALGEAGAEVEPVPPAPAPAPAPARTREASTSPAGPTRLLPADPLLFRGPILFIVPDPIGRDPGAEVLGQEGFASRTLLRLIFRRPA